MEGEKEVDIIMKARRGGEWRVAIEVPFLDKDKTGIERILRIPKIMDGGEWLGYRTYKWKESN